MVATSGMAEQLRVYKDADELAALQRAVDVADQAMQSVCAVITEGMTEKEVAWRMEVAMRELGAECPSFDTIVAAGPNGAMPHHHPSDRPIQAGEPIVIDMGARWTATVATSPAPSALAKKTRCSAKSTTSSSAPNSPPSTP